MEEAIRLLVPRVPLMFKTALFHSLWLSPTSSKWDLKAELIITMLRSIMTSNTSSISKQQAFSLRDPGVKGPMWISRVELPVPEDDLRLLLFRVIDEMKDGDETYTKPDLRPVHAEWTGYRGGVPNNAPEPSIPEAEKYANLEQETTSKLTILYFHGGAHYLMSPASHRRTTSKLAKMTGGRVLSVAYRLAPQNPFPAALLDCLVAYLSLLHPPPGSLHTAVPASNIIFAGDSAGGNLAFSLTLLLLHLHQHASTPAATTLFHGATIPLPFPLPAGIAANSPWLDVTRSLPSLTTNAKFDYLPPPSLATSSLSTSSQPAAAAAPVDPVTPHVCALWPAAPPRADIYADGPALCHPLVSPLAAPAARWTACPPVFMCVGEEQLADEIRVLARRLDAQGVRVRWEGFEAMPHCFAMLLEGSAVSERCFDGWARWMSGVVGGQEVSEGATWVRAKGAGEEVVDMQGLTGLRDEEVRAFMEGARDRRESVFEEVKRGRAEAKTVGDS